jgi:hypothetical protein
LQASHKFYEAAKILAAEPQALQLRYLTTLNALAADRTSTIIFPFPLEFLRAFTAKDSTDEPAGGKTPSP